jgi:ubiquinone/menaquinone biosynthesis C-methylase UbiE
MYLLAAFGDQYEQVEVPYAAVPREDQSQVVAGGVAEAFAPGKVVLDIAPGEAIGILGLDRDNPGATVIGVDNAYAETGAVEKPDDLTPGVHLTAGNWSSLPLADDSVDTIISRAGPFLWAKENADEMARVLDEMTRVAREGAVLRFNMSELAHGTLRRQVLGWLHERGWDLTISPNHETAVGIKRAI